MGATDKARPSKPTKKRSGRVTASKKDAAAKPKGSNADAGPAATGRYTPPTTSDQLVFKRSPIWVPILMFALLGGGALLLIFNYLPSIPPEEDNKFLLGGLALITGGFITATQFK